MVASLPRSTSAGARRVRSAIRRRLAPSPLYLASLILTSLVAPAGRLSAYTPDSPEVKQMLGRAYGYLESSAPETDFGRAALVGLTFVKSGKGESHPHVANALKLCRDACAKKDFATSGEHSAYGAAMACIFLCELDAVQHRAMIDQLLKHLLAHQKPHGGWSYDHYTTGDTSQVQYGVLCLWTAQKAGIAAPMEAGERVLAWLMRTQDPGGGYGYQGDDPGGPVRIPQNGTTPALSAAGVSSLFVLNDFLGLAGDAADASSKQAARSELPPALKPVATGAKDEFKKTRSTRVPQDLLRRSLNDGSRYCDQVKLAEDINWLHYFLYAYERYRSFRELAEGDTSLEEAKWYDDAVNFLRKTQFESGGWTSTGGGPVDTSFAILFLSRSTKKAIAKAIAGEGTLVGGRGFRGNIANAKLKDGKIIGAVQKGPVDEMLSVLEDPQNLDIESLAESPEFIELSADPKQLAAQVARLRRLVGAEKFEVRLIAVKTLGRTGDFDNAAVLIYALTDPDWRVVRAAHDALRLVSRRFEAAIPASPSEADRASIVQKWKQWYKSVNPAAVFLD